MSKEIETFESAEENASQMSKIIANFYINFAMCKKNAKIFTDYGVCVKF